MTTPRLNVPGLVTDFGLWHDLMFIDYVEGETLSRLSDPSVKDHVGDMTSKVLAQSIVREGVINADQHGGNIVVDPGKKIIHYIDYGQLTGLRTSFLGADDRSGLLKFFYGLQKQEPRILIEGARALAENPYLSAAKLAGLEKEVARLLSQSPTPQPGKLIASLVSAIENSGLSLKTSFMMGSLKGLFTPLGKEMVTPQKLSSILSEEFKTYLAKHPVAALGVARTLVNHGSGGMKALCAKVFSGFAPGRAPAASK